MRRTKDDIKQDLNQLLEQFEQVVRVECYTRDRILLNTGVELLGLDAHRFTKRLDGPSKFEYAARMDRILIDESVALEVKRINSSKGGKSCQEKHGELIRQNLNTGEPWSKGKILRGHITKRGELLEPWNKGKTKETNEMLQKISTQRLGEGNPMYGKRHSAEYKNAQSNRMRDLIESGQFTPNSNNRQTHFDVTFRGIKFRSSWEAAFFALNSHCEFETLRIPYHDADGTRRIYIVDFVDRINRVAYEIKPAELIERGNFPIKLAALQQWCVDNNYSYQIISQQYFSTNFSLLPLLEFDDKTLSKLRGLQK